MQGGTPRGGYRHPKGSYPPPRRHRRVTSNHRRDTILKIGQTTSELVRVLAYGRGILSEEQEQALIGCCKEHLGREARIAPRRKRSCQRGLRRPASPWPRIKSRRDPDRDWVLSIVPLSAPLRPIFLHTHFRGRVRTKDQEPTINCNHVRPHHTPLSSSEMRSRALPVWKRCVRLPTCWCSAYTGLNRTGSAFVHSTKAWRRFALSSRLGSP